MGHNRRTTTLIAVKLPIACSAGVGCLVLPLGLIAEERGPLGREIGRGRDGGWAGLGVADGGVVGGGGSTGEHHRSLPPRHLQDQVPGRSPIPRPAKVQNNAMGAWTIMRTKRVIWCPGAR
ncbi:hypothetical protein GW17_00007394 [Ensete ventricosum]|nr:hypothetical protein GW17_00007394 [Ensete ventricosum]